MRLEPTVDVLNATNAYRINQSIPYSFAVWKDTQVSPNLWRAESNLVGVDDISNADAHTVVQGAVTAAAGGKVLLRKSCGTMDFSTSGITTPANCDLNIEGEDKLSVEIEYSGTGSLFSIATAGRGIYLKNLQLTFTGSLGTAVAVDFTNAAWSNVSNLNLAGDWKYALKLDDATYNLGINIKCSTTEENDYGVYITGDSWNNMFIKSEFRGITNAVCLNGAAVSLNYFTGCTIYSSAGTSLYLTGSATFSSFFFNDIETATGTTFTIDAGCQHTQVIGGNATRGAGGSDYTDNGTHTTLRFLTCGTTASPKYTEMKGSSTGTGAGQTLAHGLIAAPRKAVVTPTAAGATVSGLYSDATNIYVTVTAAKTYNYTAEV